MSLASTLAQVRSPIRVIVPPTDEHPYSNMRFIGKNKGTNAAAFIESLGHSDYYLWIDGARAYVSTTTICAECSPEGEPFVADTTHCETCGVRVEAA